MAHIRMWNDGAEHNNNEPRNQTIDGFRDWGIGVTDQYTGDYTYLESGVKDNIGTAFGPPLVDLRGNIILSHNFPGGDAVLFSTVVSGQIYPGIQVLWMEDEFRIDLYVDNVKVDEISILNFQQMLGSTHFVSLGFFVEGGVRFVFTIDGQSVFDYSDVSVPSTTDAVFLGRASGIGWYGYVTLDDMYVDNAAGELYEIPPTYGFIMSLVDGDGTFQDWAVKGGGNDYLAVDDPGSPDDDGTHIWAGFASEVERFTTANVVIPTGFNISAAIPWFVARRGNSDAVSAQIRSISYDGNTDVGDDQTLPLWYTEMYGRHPLDPSTNPWTPTNFNAAEFGFETRGTI